MKGPCTMKRVVSVILMLVMIMTFAACGSSCKKDDKKLTANEAASLKLDDGDEAWIQEYLAGDTGLSKNANIEGVDNKTSSSKDGTVISWDPIPGAIAYKVYRADSDGGKYKCIATVTDTSYTDTDADGQKYYYKTTAVKKTATKSTSANKEEAGTAKAESSTATKPGETTTKGSGTTTTKTGGSSGTTNVTEKPTQKPTETTTKPVPSAPNYTPSNSKAKSARAAFEANARTASATYELALACAGSVNNNSVSKVSNGGIIALNSKSIDGFEEAYQFTKDLPISLIPPPSKSVKMIGYVFKISEDTDPEAFVENLKSGTTNICYNRINIPVFAVKEKTTDYYDRYVFFMVTG